MGCFFASFLIRVGNFTRLSPKNPGGALKASGILSGTSVADPDNWQAAQDQMREQ
jgi:hypothetical protein